MAQILVTNFIGIFIIQENKIIDKILFRDLEYKNKHHAQHCEAELLKKHPEAKKETTFTFPQEKEFLKKFWEINIAVAKQACKDAVRKEHFIMQAVASMEDIEKAVNPLVKRCREWFALYCPEVNEKVANHEAFIEIITTKSKQEILDEFNIATTMGADIATIDIEPMEEFGKQIKLLYNFKKQLEEYIEKALHDIAPNLLAVAGPVLAAELLLHAGSLEKLGKMPASTIQLLGAENALFLHLKKQGNCPRHGIIVKHPLLAGAKGEYHGKVSRKLAGILSIAARLDRFHGDQYKGFALREKLDKDVATLVSKPRKIKPRAYVPKQREERYERPRETERPFRQERSSYQNARPDHGARTGNTPFRQHRQQGAPERRPGYKYSGQHRESPRDGRSMYSRPHPRSSGYEHSQQRSESPRDGRTTHAQRPQTQTQSTMNYKTKDQQKNKQKYQPYHNDTNKKRKTFKPFRK
ncbi:NOP58 family protein [Candidatus Woesearchaeota archaeon]|nr:NOP58 family protein [Candidatus Woesearchaeota archaeon]